MEVDVDADLVTVGEAEHDVEMLHRVAIEAAGIDAADEVGAGEDRGVQQLRGATVAHDPRLWESHDLQMAPGGVCLAGSEHAFEALESCVGVHLGVTADDGGTGCNRRRERASGSRRDVTIGAPIGPVVLDQACESWFGRMRSEWKAESRGVEVGVYVGERWEQNPTSTIDRRHVRPLCYIATDV